MSGHVHLYERDGECTELRRRLEAVRAVVRAQRMLLPPGPTSAPALGALEAVEAALEAGLGDKEPETARKEALEAMLSETRAWIDWLATEVCERGVKLREDLAALEKVTR